MKAKIIWLILMFGIVFTSNLCVVKAETANSLRIIPESEVSDGEIEGAVQKVSESKDVWKEYNSQSKSLKTWWQFASGIMNWNTILDYAVYLVSFLFQVGILIWALMIIYAWYIYWMWVYKWDVWKWAWAVKFAIQWVLVVLFSYAIVKLLTSMFL